MPVNGGASEGSWWLDATAVDEFRYILDGRQAVTKVE
jgi:hypothetical protein